ncbi:uncharacterized protein V6R79_008830 [Siganus canaliculatus]
MDLLPLLCVVSAVFTGSTRAAGVLPDYLTESVGDTVMFTTNVTSTGHPSISWTFNDKLLVTSNSGIFPGPGYEGRITVSNSTGSLELRNVTVIDSGEYRVSISPPGTLGMTGNTRLDVYENVSSVVVTASSTDLVEFNSSVRLSCSSSGSSLSFHWVNGSSEVVESDRYQLSDGGANLTIVNVTRYDQGPFTCQVSNPVSEGVSAAVNLSISFGPDNVILTKSPSQDHYLSGSNVTLSCRADSSPAARFYWFVNGSQQLQTEPELNVINIQPSHSGNYSCQAFNEKTLRYQTSVSEELSVWEQVSNTFIASSANLPIEGDSYNLTCDADGSVVTREWMKDGLSLTMTDNIILSDMNTVLSFQPLKKTDSGEYSCKTSNPASSDEAKYKVTVNYGPENVQIMGPSEIQIGNLLTLNCSAESTPSANYTWILNNTEIHNSSELIINSIELLDRGNYSCEATNDITGKRSSAVHMLSVTDNKSTSDCSAGCIAGIVVACLALLVVAVGVASYIYSKRKEQNKSPKRHTPRVKNDDGHDNGTYSGSQELNYADIKVFPEQNGRSIELQGNLSEYAQIQYDNNPPAPSSPPTYEAHMEKVRNIPSA